jgi:hypothetical protein
MSEIAPRTRLPGGGRDNARFRAIITAVVPEAAALDDSEWCAAEAIIGRVVAARPPATRRQLALFVRALDVVAFVRHLRPFATLAPQDRTALLERLGSSPLLPLRRGVWGIRTLAFMGYYARPEAARAIGYRATASGWADRRGTPLPE